MPPFDKILSSLPQEKTSTALIETDITVIEKPLTPWASNVSYTYEELGKVLVRSLTPQYTNLVYTKRTGALVRVDLYYVEIESTPNTETSTSSASNPDITLNEKNILPHTTILLPLDVVQALVNQLQPLLLAAGVNMGELDKIEQSWLNLGKALIAENNLEQAREAYEKALTLNPISAEACHALAEIYKTQGERGAQRALDLYQKAIRYAPENPRYHYSMGAFYKGIYQGQASIDHFKKALEYDPSIYEAHKQLALSYVLINRPDLALESYANADKVRPNVAHKIDMATIMPRFFQTNEEMLSWRDRFRDEVKKLNDTDFKLQNVFDMEPSYYYLAYHGFNNRDLIKEYTRLFSSFQFYKEVPKVKHKKPKIGFVSRFLHKYHTIGKVFLGVINHLPRDQFDITVFTIDTPGQMPLDLPFLHVPLSASQGIVGLCESVRQQEIDILVYTDIGMDTTSQFMALNRLAPVQCVTWGHPDTTGLNTMDYYISNRLFEPPNAQDNYTEKLILMDTIPTYYRKPSEIQLGLTRADFGFSEEDHLYLCPQAFFKFHSDFDEILANIMRKDPKGIVVLANAHYPEWVGILMSRLEKTIPDVCPRIRILTKMYYEKFLALLSLGDVMLDTLYFGGGSTTYEAFSYGTPIVTRPTGAMRGRMAYGLYQKMQIQDCIADSPEEYVDIAVRLGTDPDYRESIKAKILAANHLLYEEMGAVEEFGRVLSKLYQEHFD
jgi:protein O-GlcNAc transferase